ncbi:unnamed protein product [Macrosiphum euphorbiae]|uniref:Uncharacterized protein n=1 Tax=Macrosiphum euphorbiae TaxID=13131 RepID=A0AAV0W3H6_9HEMI|nr:unnamed protein product [Macrosiphum euphorbiae]
MPHVYFSKVCASYVSERSWYDSYSRLSSFNCICSDTAPSAFGVRCEYRNKVIIRENAPLNMFVLGHVEERDRSKDWHMDFYNPKNKYVSCICTYKL